MPNADIDKRDILLSSTRNGEVLVNVGEVSDGTGVGADVATWGSAYFVSCPDVPDETGAAQALCMVDGHTKRCIGTRDNRAVAKVGEMLPGDSSMLSGGAARIQAKKEGNAISLYTETDEGKSVMVALEGGVPRIFLSIGKSYIEMKEDEIVISVGANLIRLDAAAVAVIGKAFQAACGGVTLGNFPVMPLPTDAAIKGTTGAGGTPSSSVFIAP